MNGMLHGFRIIEGSAFVAAPLAGLTLAQLGAEVIRFDLPGGGLDYGRLPRAKHSGRSLYWTALNRGKRSLAIDFRKPEGQEILSALITAPGEGSGILLTNFAGVPFLDYARLAQKRTDLIKMEIRGNRDGSSAIDYTVNAAVGLPAVTGPADDDRPVNHVLPAWDVSTGLMAANGITAAILHRLRTGEGRNMQIALSDMALATIANLAYLSEATVNDLERPRVGNDLYGGFGRDFATRDGERIIVIGLTLKQWRVLKRACGIEDEVAALAARLGADLDEEEERFRHRDAIAALVAPWIGARPLAEIAKIFEAEGVLWGPFQTFRQLLDRDPRARLGDGVLRRLDQPGIGPVISADAPLLVDGQAVGRARPAAAEIGADTDAILSEHLGLSSVEIGRLHDAKIVGGPKHRAEGTV